ncbi:MAG: L,D-transpeptidase family protein [Methylohalobius crimeensis]
MIRHAMNRYILVWLALLLSLSGCQSLLPRFGEIAPESLETERFHISQQDRLIGRIARISVREGDTLADIARHFGIGLQAIRDANPGIDPWLPPAGEEVLLPLAFILPDTPREGMVLNLPAMRLFYFPPDDSGAVWSYPVGIGREDWETPRGKTRIVQKKADPSWFVPASIRREHARKGDPLPRVVPPGPDNPLGSHALRLGMPGYLIHGTNKPYGVGLRVSHGCIRLYPEDIAALFPRVPVGTPVAIVDQPYLIDRLGDEIYLQVFPPLQSDGKRLHALKQAVIRDLREIERTSEVSVDWEKVDRAIAGSHGIPLPVGGRSLAWQAYLERTPRLSHPTSWRGDYQPPAADPGWYLVVDEVFSESNARRLVAMLKHQGPPLPARLIRTEAGERAMIGPYGNETKAKTVQRRLQRELDLATRLRFRKSYSALSSVSRRNAGP